MATLRSLDDLIRLLERARVDGGPGRSADRDRRKIVGIAGSPGAGKSTIAERLVDMMMPDAALLPMDGFHLPQARLVELGRRERMGAPDTFDVGAFLSVLARIRADDGDVRAPGFDRDIEEPTPGTIVIPSAVRTVVVEGNYLLLRDHGWGPAREALDSTVFVRVDRDIRLARLVARHERFGKSPAEARAWTLGPDDANSRVIEETVQHAEHVLELG